MIIGYLFTSVYIVLFVGLLASLVFSASEIKKAMKGRISKASILAALLIVAFFVAFSLLYVHPAEQLYFDENIYQGIALNILNNFNALWCQYGTSYVTHCYNNAIYHDPVELSFYLAIAFAAFGASIQTAFGLELAIGAVSVILVFLLASAMFGKKTGIASAVVFALLPELFIWSRTMAVPDLALMMFTILAFFAYFIFMNSKRLSTLAFLLCSIGIVAYMRIEGLLLVPIFIILYLIQSNDSSSITKSLQNDFKRKAAIALVILFIISLIPEIYYVMYELHGLNYGSGSLCGRVSNATFSLSNFNCNISPNVDYFFGAYNAVAFFPAYFSVITTAAAIIGFLLMTLFSKKGWLPAAVLGIWILAYHVFYDSFYAGSVVYGVDVRFMLVIYPAIAIFAGYAIAHLSASGANFAVKSDKKAEKGKKIAVATAIYLILITLFAIYPFISATHNITLPPLQMPQEPMPYSATSFIYNNYQAVPANCLVFSFTPDVWYELNRSAVQIGYFQNENETFVSFEKNYNCYVLDIGYWCSTGQFKDSVCRTDLQGFNTTQLATSTATSSIGNFSFYRLNNYKP